MVDSRYLSPEMTTAMRETDGVVGVATVVAWIDSSPTRSVVVAVDGLVACPGVGPPSPAPLPPSPGPLNCVPI